MYDYIYLFVKVCAWGETEYPNMDGIWCYQKRSHLMVSRVQDYDLHQNRLAHRWNGWRLAILCMAQDDSPQCPQVLGQTGT